MNKREALREVATYWAGAIQGGDFDEATGLNTEDLSEADQARLSWAISEVVDRLYRMGGRGPDPAPH